MADVSLDRDASRNAPDLIITRLAGGLGNQLFQYAAGRRLAHHRRVPLKLDTSGYGPEGEYQAPGLEAFRRRVRLDEFNVTALRATPEEVAALRDPYNDAATRSRVVRQLRRFKKDLLWPTTHYAERQYRFDPAILDLSAPRYLSGFWQSEKYFADIASLIRQEVTPTAASISEQARQYVAGLRRDSGSVISLHVRRGDLAHASETLKRPGAVYGPPTALEYVERAMAYFPPPCTFLVFSDSEQDIAWCRRHIRAERLAFSSGRTDVEDLVLMSQCDHHIIANSTFSWWGAWLNPSMDKRVIAPSAWGHAGGVVVTDDLIPPAWTMI